MAGKVKTAATWIENAIKRFTVESPENSLKNSENERAWAEPLVGFSSGADPLYQFYKKDIGEFYFSPAEMFSKTFPKVSTAADQLTVVSWILPHTEATKDEHRKGESKFPTERWARARMFGEDFNDALRRHVVATLMAEGMKHSRLHFLLYGELECQVSISSRQIGRNDMLHTRPVLEPSVSAMG